jgi:hypothetical protein
MGRTTARQRPAEPSLVSVSVAEAERLHAVAHQAANSVRSIEDWWDNSLTTGLAAVTRARHSSAYRDEAEGAVSRLLRWWQDEHPRRISRDVTALALAARAAADLQQQEPRLVEDAAEAVDDLARRDSSSVPMLHLALCAWALYELVPDRDQKPWPELRKRLQEHRFGGVEAPLRQYTAALAARQLDANALVQDLLGSIGSAPSRTDSCVLVWVITAAAERLTRSLSSDDNALQVLFQRRATIVERLAGGVDDHTFRVPDLEEFGEPIPDDLPVINYLSPFEALLLDFALASPEEADAWLRFPEAEALFGERAAQAEDAVASATDRHQRLSAGLVAVLGVTAGLAVWLGLLDLDRKRAVAASLAVAVALVALGIAALFGRAGGLSERLMEAIGVLSLAVACLALLNAYNQHRHHPFLSDVTGIVVGVVVSSVALLAWLAGTRFLRKRSEST